MPPPRRHGPQRGYGPGAAGQLGGEAAGLPCPRQLDVHPAPRDRAAAREAEIRDHALDAIDEAITRFRADLQATERKLIDGEWVEVPVLRITPRDLALMIDRFQVLFGRPAMISEGRGFAATITSEALPVDVIKGIVELTRGLAGAPTPEASPLRRLPPRPRN